ncbi:MAG TPA: haloacid dehalogenase type II [Actinomycetes bacterium]|nr:haloacid dehalogenase type II [Actinomycetes bacterium]
MNFANFKALSFDCYGTLIDWESGILALLRPWADSHGLEVTDDELLASYGDHESRAELDHPTLPYPEILARSFLGVGDQWGADVSLEDGRRLGQSVGDWPAFDDSASALQTLAQRYQLIILSNVDRDSFALSQQKLGVTFDRVLTAQDIGSYKPAGRNFKTLLAETERMGVNAGELLHVAQSLFHDHAPAKQYGLATVWINRRAGRQGWGATPAPAADVVPTAEFTNMADFARAVEQELTP